MSKWTRLFCQQSKAKDTCRKCSRKNLHQGDISNPKVPVTEAFKASPCHCLFLIKILIYIYFPSLKEIKMKSLLTISKKIVKLIIQHYREERASTGLWMGNICIVVMCLLLNFCVILEKSRSFSTKWGSYIKPSTELDDPGNQN